MVVHSESKKKICEIRRMRVTLMRCREVWRLEGMIRDGKGWSEAVL